MKIELNKNTNLKWEDLKCGDVFIDGDNDVCMKVEYLKEYVLDLSSGELFDDYDSYNIVKVVKCKLVKDED